MKTSQAAPVSHDRWQDRLLLATISIALLLKLHLVFLLNINWDEHHYLSYVHEHARGALTNPWQTFHVHLFSWLVEVPGYEIAQVFVARFVLWGLAVVSAFLVYGLARRFLTRTAALFAVLCSLSFSYLIEHGTSFRPDTLSIPLFLGGLYLLLTRDSVRSAMLAGLLLAISCMVTIKSILFVGLGGLLLLLRWWQDRNLKLFLRRSGACSLIFLGGLVALGLWHRWGLMTIELPTTSRYLASSASKVFLANGFFPRWLYFLHSLGQDLLSWLLLLIGTLIACRKILMGGSKERLRGLFLLSLSLPLLSLLFYRNAFPYFYVFVLPTACLLGGLTMETWTASTRTRSPRVSILMGVLLVLAMGGQIGTHYLGQAFDQNKQQKVLLATIHRMFPEPVPYVDRCSMVASFPKVGFFMSSWGLETYAAASQEVISDAVWEDHPPFVIANVPSLWFFLPDQEYSQLRFPLLARDLATLRENYVQHWGWLFVAGKKWALQPQENKSFEVLVPGPYTLEGGIAVVLDGKIVEPGSVVDLAPGQHRVSTSEESGEVTLRWGNHIFRPAQQPPIQMLFRDF